jgi:hypothetical protein
MPKQIRIAVTILATIVPAFRGRVFVASYCLAALSIVNSIPASASDLKGNVQEYSTGTDASTGSMSGGAFDFGHALDGVAGSTNINAGTSKSGSSPSLSGNATETRLNGSGTFLEGGTKADESLKNRLRVIKGIPDSLPGNQFPLQVEQFNGSRSTNSRMPPSWSSPAPVQNWDHYGRPIGGSIPPISSYTMTPRNGVTTYRPGMEMTPTTINGVMTFSPGYSITGSSYGGISHGNGITTFDTAYDVSGATTRSGVTSWIPGWGSISGIAGNISGWMSSAPFSFHGVTSYLKGDGESTIYSATANTNQAGTSEHMSTSKNGVTCWSPGYEVQISSAGLTKESLGGVWSAPGGVRREPGLIATTEALPSPQYFVQPVVGEGPLMARAQTLPGIEVGAVTWEQWYKTVARAIYSRWRYAEVAPGVAKVRVTVLRNKEMAARVVDFVPVLGVDRNADNEKTFREAALKAVNSVESYEIPPFPKGVDSPQVSFDVEMKRTVEGDAGFDISSGRSD